MSEDRDPLASTPELVPRRRLWPPIVVFVALAATAVAFAVRASRAPKPLRVLVAVDLDGQWWEGSQAAATLADRLGSRLAKVGFDPVRAGDPEVAKVLERAKTPADAARALHAAFVISATIAPEVIAHATPSGPYHEVRADAPVQVGHVERLEGGIGAEVGRVHQFAGAKERARALDVLAEGLADQTFDAAIGAILADPSIQELLDDRQSSLGPAIYPARDFVRERDHRVKVAREAYDALRAKHLEEERGPVKPTWHSEPSAQDELAGVGHGGALVSTNGVRPFYFVETKSVGWIHELESIEWRGAGAPSVLWKGYNLYGYPGVAPGGARVVLVEDLFGWAKTITVVDGPGAKARRVRVDPEHRFVDPRVAPGGKLAAVWDRPCPTCAGALLVVSTEDGKDVFRAEHEDGRFEGVTWLDPTHLAFLHAPAEDSTGRLVAKREGEDVPAEALWIVDVGASPPALEPGRPVPVGAAWTSPSASPDGARVAFELAGRKAFGIFERASGAFAVHELEAFARSPSWSPDGKTLAIELSTGGPTEIATVPASGGAVTALTKNPFRDRYPTFSADGARIFYETTDDDPAFQGRRRVSWIASVPAAP